jgi:hypothetical protein
MLNAWQKTLTVEEVERLTSKGTFPLPQMPSYSRVVAISNGTYYGAIGYGNGTEHKVLLVLDPYHHGGCLHIGVQERGYYNFNLQEAQSTGIAWPYIREKLKGVGEWEAHLLSIAVRTILRRVGSGQSPYWDRPAAYRAEHELGKMEHD